MRLLSPVVFVSSSLCLLLALPDLVLGDRPKSDNVERLVLIDGKTLNGWEAVESTLSPAAVEGTPALLFSVPVDWRAGEPNYPIGWPRIQMSVPAEMSDWRKWERMRLRVYALTSRDPLPYRPLGVTVSSADRNVSWERDAEGLRTGEWRECTFDLRDVPERGRVRSIGVFVSEDAYLDGEKLSFYISDLELLRYTRPTLVGFDLLAAVAFADAKALPVAVKMLGLGEGETAPVALRLKEGDKMLAQADVLVPKDVTQISLPLPTGIGPGQYRLVASSGGEERARAVRLVSSPWEGEAR
jgi:hypothetical protein